MPLNDIVNVVITRQTQSVSEQGFGIPMILGTNVNFTDLIRFYSNMAGVAEDFTSNTPEYIASQDIFSQEISPVKIAIGRRQVDNLTLDVVTAITGKTYTVVGNGITVSYNSTSAFVYSIVTLDNDLILNNRINVVLNGTGIGTVTSVIDFNIDFEASTSTLSTVNGVALSPVIWTGLQATTIANVATELLNGSNVLSATVTGTRQITVIFNGVGVNTVNSVVTTGGANNAVATIAQGGFVFTTDTATTMQNIATQILVQFPTYSATVSPSPSRILTVSAPIGTSAIVNTFAVTGGASQAVAGIVTPQQPVTDITIASGLSALINAVALFPVTATPDGNGNINFVNKVAGTPYTFRAETNIGNPNNANVRITQILPETTYTVTINGVQFSYTTLINIQTADQVAQALVDLINLVPQRIIINASNNGDGTFNVNSVNPIDDFSLAVSNEIMSIEKGLVITNLVNANPVATDLNAIVNVNNDWYALISVDRDKPTVLAIAGWVETKRKIFGTASDDLAIINVQAGTDVSSISALLNQAGYVRSFVMYHQDASFDYPEAALMGRCLPLIPGSETWAFKRLNTISYSKLTTTQQNNALNKKTNIYTFVAGVGITQNGTMAQGEYIDIVRGIDWLTARIQEGVFSLLVNNNKIPYTDGGISTVQAEVLRVLKLGIDNGLISDNPEPTCTVPLAINVPSVDKTNRILKNVRFQCTLAGAIQAVEIFGNVSV